MTFLRRVCLFLFFYNLLSYFLARCARSLSCWATITYGAEEVALLQKERPGRSIVRASLLLLGAIGSGHIFQDVSGLATKHLANLIEGVHGVLLHAASADRRHRGRSYACFLGQVLLGHFPDGQHHFQLRFNHVAYPLGITLPRFSLLVNTTPELPGRSCMRWPWGSYKFSWGPPGHEALNLTSWEVCSRL